MWGQQPLAAAVRRARSCSEAHFRRPPASYDNVDLSLPNRTSSASAGVMQCVSQERHGSSVERKRRGGDKGREKRTIRCVITVVKI